jgi:general secretion pathway protein G
MRRKMNKRRSAFTLMELLLVTGILAVLAAFAIPNLMSSGTKAKNNIAKAAVKGNGGIAKGLDQYKWDMGVYPSTDEGLAALYKKKGEADDDRYNGPYMNGAYEEMLDPWGKPYEYRSPGDVNEESYDLWSRGEDGKDDGGKSGSDDIKNWIEK